MTQQKATKAARIRALLDGGAHTVAEICAIVDAEPEYVRVVRQRRATGRSVSDNNYYDRWRAEGDLDLARAKAREARRAVVAAGGSREKAKDAYRLVWERTLRHTAKAKRESSRVEASDAAPARNPDPCGAREQLQADQPAHEYRPSHGQ